MCGVGLDGVVGFNPRAPRGARPTPGTTRNRIIGFQSTRPARGATNGPDAIIVARAVSIHAPRAGRDYRMRRPEGRRGVSIHAPRAGRDRPRHTPRSAPAGFNPRAPRGARLPVRRQLCSPDEFQSTRPARGATRCDPRFWAPTWFQSTRPARGATSPLLTTNLTTPCFNPRAPRGARHDGLGTGQNDLSVSIHAPRAGRDLFSRPAISGATCFNPRAPRGARLRHVEAGADAGGFQSTRPARGATRLGG